MEFTARIRAKRNMCNIRNESNAIWSEALPIECWVVVHRLTEGPLSASSDGDSKVRIVTPDALLREVGNWLAEEGDQVNVYAHEFVLRQRLG